MLRNRLLLFVALSLFTFSPLFAQSEEVNEDAAAELFAEYVQINQRLQTVQQKALQDEELSERSVAFVQRVELEMVKNDPSVRTMLDKRNRIVQDFETAQENGDSEEMESLQQEFILLSQQIQSHQTAALQNEELFQEGKQLETLVIEKMEEIDPEVPNLLSRVETIGKELQNYQQR
jgi:hypothetical protein